VIEVIILFEYIGLDAESGGVPLAVMTPIVKLPIPTVRMWPAASTRAMVVSLLVQRMAGMATVDPFAAWPVTLAIAESPATMVSPAISRVMLAKARSLEGPVPSLPHADVSRMEEAAIVTMRAAE
jgi:hypothetical protein